MRLLVWGSPKVDSDPPSDKKCTAFYPLELPPLCLPLSLYFEFATDGFIATQFRLLLYPF
jgi:hypothetical protein